MVFARNMSDKIASRAPQPPGVLVLQGRGRDDDDDDFCTYKVRVSQAGRQSVQGNVNK